MGQAAARCTVGAVVFAAFACGILPGAKAEEAIRPATIDSASRFYFFAGADVGIASGFLWAGVAAAPFAKLDEDGIRLRAFGGTGNYRYDTSAVPGGENKGTVSTGELLIGKRLSFDATTLTAYAGLDARNYSLRNPDPGNPVVGSKTGVKALLEGYTRFSPDWFATGYASISSVFQSYSVRPSLNYNLTPAMSLGVEGVFHGDERYNEQRTGLVASMSFARNVLSFASGVLHNSDKGNGAYTTLTIYSPF